MMNLFRSGRFVLHSGGESNLFIDCDALADEDWRAITKIVASKIAYRCAIGVVAGGEKFADALNLCNRDKDAPILLVDDVLTTGISMERLRWGYLRSESIGIVLFARGECPDWIHPIFELDKFWG